MIKAVSRRRACGIDENPCRNELTTLEQGEYLKRRKEIYELKYPETKAGVAGGKASQEAQNLPNSNNINDRTKEIISFVDSTAAKTGLSSKSIRLLS